MTYTFPAGFGVLAPFDEILDYQKRILQTHWDWLTHAEQFTVESCLAKWKKKGSPGGYEGESQLHLRHPEPADGPSVTKEALEVDPPPVSQSTPQADPGPGV